MGSLQRSSCDCWYYPVASFPLPPINLKKERLQLYASRSKDLGAEVDLLKTQIDLVDFAVLIDNLMEPGMAKEVLRPLDQFIVKNTGTKMGLLYQDLAEDCV